MGRVTIGSGATSRRYPTTEGAYAAAPQVVEVERIVEVEKIVEVKVPEYITVIREERVEVPVIQYIEVPVEKIVEVPKIQVVEKPVYITHEVYDVTKVLLEKKAHDRTKRRMDIACIILAFSLIANFLLAVK